MLRDDKGYSLKGQNLTIFNVQPEDAGLYFCIGKNNEALTPAFLHLTVIQEDEVIVQRPQNLTLSVGDRALFTCKSHDKLLRQATSWVKLEQNFQEGFVVLAEATEILEIENVTFADEGFYACVVGNEVANVQAVAFLSVEEALENDLQDNFFIWIIVCVLCLVFFGLVAAIWVLVRKWHGEKKAKKHAIDRAQALSQWTKKVIIERQASNSDSLLSVPVVRIEKMKTQLSRYKLASQDTMTTISEYELPLDIDWEFPREQLFLDKVIGEGAFGKVLVLISFKYFACHFVRIFQVFL